MKKLLALSFTLMLAGCGGAVIDGGGLSVGISPVYSGYGGGGYYSRPYWGGGWRHRPHWGGGGGRYWGGSGGRHWGGGSRGWGGGGGGHHGRPHSRGR